MKQNRVLPFGYEMRQGQVVPHPRECEVLRYIFQSYIEGDSFGGLAQALTQGDVPYHSGSHVWNKNMIKRILENGRYTGTDGYPALVTAEQFAAAQRLRQGKTEGYAPRPPHADLLRGRLVCSHCGARLQRDTRKRYPRWVCPQRDGCCSIAAIREDVLVESILGMLRHLAADVRRVEVPATEIGAASPESIRLANEIRRETEKPGCDEERTLALILAAAGEQYALCDDGGAAIRAQDIRSRLGAMRSISTLDPPLFEGILKSVTVYPPQGVELLLATGQRVGATDTSAERSDAS